MNHVKHYLTQFDFTGGLLAAISTWDSQPTPPSSPALAVSEYGDLFNTSDLSPLTTPPSSPPSSPPILVNPLPDDPVCSATKALKYDNPLEFWDAEMEDGTHSLSEGASEAGGKPSCSDAVPMSRAAKIKARRHLRSRAGRKKVRICESEAIDSHHIAREQARKMYVDGAAAFESNLETEKSKVAGSAYVARNECGQSKKVYMLGEVTGEGSKFNFTLIKWNGSKTISILDKCRRVIGILAGHPQSKDWPSVHANAAEAIEMQRSRIEVPKKDRRHRRGAFPALRCGVLHGGGQWKPTNLTNHPTNAGVLDWLNNLKPFKRIAGFASSVLATWAPKLHGYYVKTVNALHINDPSLRRIFPSGIFSAASYNFGPRTLCFKHKDFANLPFGFCAITALGNFDPTKGGHLILWDLELVIQFPPGSTILIPSALIAHSNTAIGKDERCYSFTQYTAGAIFRWVDNNFATQEAHLLTLTAEELETKRKENEARWEYGLSLLPTVSEGAPVVEL